MAETTGILPTLWIITRLLVRRCVKLLASQHRDSVRTFDIPLDALPAGNQWCCATVQAGREEWTKTGMLVKAGEEITLFADGCVVLSSLFDLKIGPKVGLWYRIGTGEVSKFPSSCATVKASSDGEIQLALKPPGEWALQDGTFDPRYSRQLGKGGFSVSMVRWQTCTAKQGLQEWSVISGHSRIIQTVLDQLCNAPETPPGWNYLWRLGEGSIYQMMEDQLPSIRCHTHEDVGILQFPVDVPLIPELNLSWQWRVERLPSQIREDVQPTHDYLSIAVEFDNGLDLTYLWSSELPVGKIFQCPLPWWSDRETHWVVRSGQRQLGQWLSEHRCLLDDYRLAIGGKDPERVVGVWLIAVSVFQRNTGICDYRNIELTKCDGSAIVVAPGAAKQNV